MEIHLRAKNIVVQLLNQFKVKFPLEPILDLPFQHSNGHAQEVHEVFSTYGPHKS
jgi:hypothetical protein